MIYTHTQKPDSKYNLKTVMAKILKYLRISCLVKKNEFIFIKKVNQIQN